jgi:hypothetical protein
VPNQYAGWCRAPAKFHPSGPGPICRCTDRDPRQKPDWRFLARRRSSSKSARRFVLIPPGAPVKPERHDRCEPTRTGPDLLEIGLLDGSRPGKAEVERQPGGVCNCLSQPCAKKYCTDIQHQNKHTIQVQEEAKCKGTVSSKKVESAKTWYWPRGRRSRFFWYQPMHPMQQVPSRLCHNAES